VVASASCFAVLSAARTRFTSAALLFLLLGPALASAERAPYWLVPGGGVAWLPNEFDVKPRVPLVGGILGARISPSWAAEMRGTYFKSAGTQPTTPNLGIVRVEGGLTWFLLGDRSFTPYFLGGAGIAYLHYEGAASSLHQFAVGGGLGFRKALGENVSLRIEGRDLRYRLPSATSAAQEYRNEPEVYAGISFGIGGPPRDRDHDGVPDEDDRCPGTPVGARVDAVGCALDSDNDGVFDGLDQCPNTPPGAKVDARGCELDQDGDGVADGIDKCPDTPKGATVDAEGCPHDEDQDHVPDGLDQCPATPRGCLVNANGCPTDADQDGVCDGLDQCPDTPPNAKVDQTGCPIVVSDKETQLLETGMIRLQNINFDTGRASILPESEPVLDEVGNILARWPELKIEIGGHTDSQGSAAKNAQLSKDRARAVLEYLTSKFPELDSSQFTTVGYGASKPIANNTTQLGRSKNRRVEFKVLNKNALRREKTEKRLLPRDQGQ
jgi:OOP family OmpA-OmpF porin